MLIPALLAPFWGAFLTYCRGASVHGSAPGFLDKWLLELHPEEPSWRLQRGWIVALIGVWPAIVVWSLLAEQLLKHKLVWINGWSILGWSLDIDWHWDGAITFAAIAWAGASAALTLGHARYQDFGTYVPPGKTQPDETYAEDFLGMLWTGAAEAVTAALVVAYFGYWVEAAIMLIGGAFKAVAYAIGWTKIPQRVFGDYWEPTRAAEVLQGAFLYAGFSVALLVRGGW